MKQKEVAVDMEALTLNNIGASMKCVFTGNETKDKTKNIAVSREGRELLRQMQTAMAEARQTDYNEMITEVNEKATQKASEKGEVAFQIPTEEDVTKFTPSISQVLTEQVRQNKEK